MMMLTVVVGLGARQEVGVFIDILRRKRPFYSCLFSDLAFDWLRGWM